MSIQCCDKIKPVKHMHCLKCTINMYTKYFLTAASYPWPFGSLYGFTVFTYEVTVYNLGYFYLNFTVVCYSARHWTAQSPSHFSYIQGWIPFYEWSTLSNRLTCLLLASAGNVIIQVFLYLVSSMLCLPAILENEQLAHVPPLLSDISQREN